MESKNHGTKETETKTNENERIFKTPAGDVNLNELDLNKDKFEQTPQTTQTTDNNQENEKIERKALKNWTDSDFFDFFKAKRELANLEKYNEQDWIDHFKGKMEEATNESNRIKYIIYTGRLERAEQIAARIRHLRAFPKEEKLPIEKKKNEFIAMDNYPKKQKESITSQNSNPGPDQPTLQTLREKRKEETLKEQKAQPQIKQRRSR